MPPQHFCKLIDEICNIARIPNSRLLYEAADLEIDHVKFTLADGGDKTENCVTFYCDFGLLPPQIVRAGAMQRLLELNLSMYGINTPFFSINSEINHVLLIGRIPTAEMSPENLMNALAKHAAQAKEWRRNYYLDAEERSQQSSGRQSYQDLIMKRNAA